MNSFQVLNGGGAAQVEEVSANTNIPSAVALAGCDVSERVFDRGSLA
jgi:hypothetical protein